MGVDPSSGITGLAVCEGRDVLYHGIFEADNENVQLWENMRRFFVMCDRLMKQFQPLDGVVVEKVSVSWNVNTIRKISYYEAMAMLLGARKEIPVYQPQATKARRIALGHGGLSKEKCYEIMTERYSQINWLPGSKGGMDETDAAVLAFAGEALSQGE